MTILSFSLMQRQPWDLAGIGASSLCVIHCLATPLLVVFLPILEVVEKQTHAGFALAILGIGLLAFGQAIADTGAGESSLPRSSASV